MKRQIFDVEHDLFREQVRRFVANQITPFHEEWNESGCVPRELWLQAGKAGLLCPALPEEYGGGGGDRLHSIVVFEELCRVGATGPGFQMHSDIVASYIEYHGTESQKLRFLPDMAAGQKIGALAMTEPGAGSDLRGISTRAERNGDMYVVNGQKTFISNGMMADTIVTAVKTGDAKGRQGISLLIIPGDAPGLMRGKNLKKLGSHAQDTAELFFEDVRVPVDNLLGSEGQGMRQMMKELAWERLQIAAGAAALMEAAFDWTLEFVRGRQAFGQPIVEFQNTRFKLAEIKTQVEVARTFVDRCLGDMMHGELDPITAAMAKCWVTDAQSRILDECLQLHGGYGYIWDYPICRAYADTRIHRIFGGTNEIMKELIGRSFT